MSGGGQNETANKKARKGKKKWKKNISILLRFGQIWSDLVRFTQIWSEAPACQNRVVHWIHFLKEPGFGGQILKFNLGAVNCR